MRCGEPVDKRAEAEASGQRRPRDFRFAMDSERGGLHVHRDGGEKQHVFASGAPPRSSLLGLDRLAAQKRADEDRMGELDLI